MQLNLNNIKRYLNYHGKNVDSVTQANIDQAIKLVSKNANLRFQIIPIKVEIEEGKKVLINQQVEIDSVGLAKFFATQEPYFLMSATLGREIDNLIKKYEILDLGLAYAINAVATEYIECFIDDNLETRFQVVTSRFSLGYGDSPLIKQKEILKLLNNTSISVLDNGLLIPSKSVTAFVKLSDINIDKCLTCQLKNKCAQECKEV